LAGSHDHRIRQHLVHPDDDEHQPAPFRRRLRRKESARPAAGQRPPCDRDRDRQTVREISETAIANLEYESIRHTAPTFHGDTLYAETTVLEITPSKTRSDRGVLYVESRGLNQKGEMVLTLRRRVLIPRRPAAPA
jgi:hypothetical protein